MALMRFTSPTLGDSVVNEDLTVITDGVLNQNAVVTFEDGTLRLDVSGNGIIDTNDIPGLGDVRVTRQPGWQGSLGYRVVLLDWAEDTTPDAIAMAIYNLPDGESYSFTTGGMIWDNELKEWYTVCPPGFEPSEGEDIYMGFLFGSLNIAAFTMKSYWEEHIFSGGGDFN